MYPLPSAGGPVDDVAMDRTTCTPRALRTTVSIQPITAEDAFAVAALHIQGMRERGEVVPTGYLDAFADAWLGDPDRVGWLARDPRGKPLAALHGRVEPSLPTATTAAGRRLRLEHELVCEAARETGLEERLRRAAAAYAADSGLVTVLPPPT